MHNIGDMADALCIEAYLGFECLLATGRYPRGRRVIIGLNVCVTSEPLNRLLRQAPAVLEVPVRDLLLCWMRWEPVTAPPQQFVDLIVANPVVLLIVKNRDHYIDVT